MVQAVFGHRVVQVEPVCREEGQSLILSLRTFEFPGFYLLDVDAMLRQRQRCDEERAVGLQFT